MMIHKFNHYKKLLLAPFVVISLFLLSFAFADDFLDVDQAFKLKVDLNNTGTLHFSWTIAPRYKLYRERLKFGVETVAVQLGTPVIPNGQRKFDPSLNKAIEVYHNKLDIKMAIKKASEPFVLKVSYQGCAEEGMCYPPVDKRYTVDPANPGTLKLLNASGNLSAQAPALNSQLPQAPTADNEESLVQHTLQSGGLWHIGLAFFIFGLLLSFTPCVLPMIPILSSIIIGAGTVTRNRSFLLALMYCLGMVLIYTAMGIGAGLAGAGLATALQKPWVISVFAGLLFLLSLSMFDVYQLQLPSSLQTRLNETSTHLSGGRFLGVFVMGALSALIIGPCVAAPLAGALLYISRTGDVWIGGWALFSMATGMSVPLLLTGLSAGSLLPRAGNWMNGVKRLFGLLLMATAIWMIAPILPSWALMGITGLFAMLCAVHLPIFCYAHQHELGISHQFGRAIGLIFFLFGAFELAGVASGGTDVLQPLAHLRETTHSTMAAQQQAVFKRIHSLQELQYELAHAQAPVLLDFYADWCLACKEMEHFTFSDPNVRNVMARFTLLQADVTANSEADRILLKKFALFGPPAIIIFDQYGKELPKHRIIGYMPKELFLRHLLDRLA